VRAGQEVLQELARRDLMVEILIYQIILLSHMVEVEVAVYFQQGVLDVQGDQAAAAALRQEQAFLGKDFLELLKLLLSQVAVVVLDNQDKVKMVETD
jgi:hypothetical protein